MEFACGPGREGVEVAADVGDEALRELAAGVELGEVADDGAPEEAINAGGGGGGRVARRVKVEGALEGGNSGAGKALPFLRLGRVVRMGGGGGGGGGGGDGGGRGGVEGLGAVVGLHEHLLDHVLIRARPPRPALQRRSHRHHFTQ